MKKLKFEGAEVTVVRSDRKTIAIHIKPEGLCVRGPKSMTDREVVEVLESKRLLIRKHIQTIAARTEAAEAEGSFTHEQLQALTKEASAYIPQRVRYYANIIGVDYGRITIRSQRTRWGSCSSKGNLNFNCLLMLFPKDVIDSVVVHELCHRKHMNHSPRFYAEVRKAFPQYDQCDAWLKKNGGRYLRRLP